MNPAELETELAGGELRPAYLLAGSEALLREDLLALLRQRGEWERLGRRPELAAAAVEECLRYDAPVQFTSRRPWEDVEIFGKRVPGDMEIVLVLGAAHRDPARFEDPDRLDISRSDNAHLAFGQGIHFCLGASLARLEAGIAFRALVQRFPEMELACETVDYRPGFAIRALESLPVSFGGL